MDYLATMTVTSVATSPQGTNSSLTSMPVSDMAECRRSMTSYVDDMPDTEVTGRGENYIVAKIVPTFGATVVFYVKCQTRGKS
jgi:hypothetical protein